jgi:hypothetical protein
MLRQLLCSDVIERVAISGAVEQVFLMVATQDHVIAAASDV